MHNETPGISYRLSAGVPSQHYVEILAHSVMVLVGGWH